jgi:spore coat protein JB
MNEEREIMLKELMSLDFTLIDLHLFLDTHPCDCNAVSVYNDVVNKRNVLKQEYQKRFGPLVANSVESKCPWQWIESPWPWNSYYK